jgi:hypothetical protein
MTQGTSWPYYTTADEQNQAEFLAQQYVTAASMEAMGVETDIWFNSVDWCATGCLDGQGYGVLSLDQVTGDPNDNKTATKQAYTALQTLQLLRPCVYVGNLTSSTNPSVPSGVRCYVFKNTDGSATLAIWAPTRTAVTLPVSTIGSSVTWEDYMGYTPGSGNSTEGPVTNSNGNWSWNSDTGTIYATECNPAIFSSVVAPGYPAWTPGSSTCPVPSTSQVWASIENPTTTDRPYVAAGVATPLTVYVQNQGSTSQAGTVSLSVAGCTVSPTQKSWSLGADGTTSVQFNVTAPASPTSGLLAATHLPLLRLRLRSLQEPRSNSGQIPLLNSTHFIVRAVQGVDPRHGSVITGFTTSTARAQQPAQLSTCTSAGTEERNGR